MNLWFWDWLTCYVFVMIVIGIVMAHFVGRR